MRISSRIRKYASCHRKNKLIPKCGDLALRIFVPPGIPESHAAVSGNGQIIRGEVYEQNRPRFKLRACQLTSQEYAHNYKTIYTTLS